MQFVMATMARMTVWQIQKKGTVVDTLKIRRIAKPVEKVISKTKAISVCERVRPRQCRFRGC